MERLSVSERVLSERLPSAKYFRAVLALPDLGRMFTSHVTVEHSLVLTHFWTLVTNYWSIRVYAEVVS